MVSQLETAALVSCESPQTKGDTFPSTPSSDCSEDEGGRLNCETWSGFRLQVYFLCSWALASEELSAVALARQLQTGYGGSVG